MSPTDNVYGGDTFEEGTEILAARIYTRPTLDILKTRTRALPLRARAFVCLFGARGKRRGLAPEPPRATRSQPESIRDFFPISIFPTSA